MPCDCWTEDVWRAVHIFALTSSFTRTEEKIAFCTFLVSLNRIISCPDVEYAVCFFMSEPDNDVMNYIPNDSETKKASRDMLFAWTHRLREAVCKAVGIPCKKLHELSLFYKQSSLTKDVWGPCVWKLMHMTLLQTKMVDFKCTEKMQAAAKAFVVCIAILIPCPKCRTHAWEYYSNHDISPYLDTNLHAFEWSVIFHNKVTERTNQENGYKRMLYTPAKALELYAKVPKNTSFEGKFLSI